MTTMLLQPDHEDKLLGRLGAPEQSTEPDLQVQIDALNIEAQTHPHTPLACGRCDEIRVAVADLRKRQRIARGDFVGAQRGMLG